MFITLIHPSNRQNLISLANETMDELFVKEGLLVIEDFYNKTGTLVLLDSKTLPHIQVFRDQSEIFNTVTLNSHFRMAHFQTIVFVYSGQNPDTLVTMEPDSLPQANYVSEFENTRGQRIIMVHLSELFMLPMIQTFIDQWGETYLVERSIYQRDPSLDDNRFKNLALPPQVCRIPNAVESNVLSGFPLDDLRVPTIGSIKAKVVYLDFLDYRQNPNDPTLEEQFLPLGNDVNRYLEYVSYGKMQFEWDIHPEPLLMPKNVHEYELVESGKRPGFYPALEIVYEMLDLHRNQLDFTGVEVIVLLLNPKIPLDLATLGYAHPVDLGRPFVTNQGNQYNAVTITLEAWPQHKWQLIFHELGHTLGLIDLYDFGPVENFDDYHRHVGGFDIMGMLSEQNLEVLGWNRYLMNWIEDDQVFCIDPPTEPIIVPMQTIGLPAEPEEIQMIVIQLDRYKVLVIEAKEVNPYCLVCDGLLVYTVDTTIPNGRGSMKIIPMDRSIDRLKYDAMIRVGETLIAYGFEISLQSASPEGYVVELNKVS
jgi:hypothetical protein